MDKFSFPVFIDDTIGSFANVDVLPYADLLITSLTKSFSGYADVMGGSVVLNPLSAFYPQLKPLFATHFHNELFTGDAETLLANSADYLARTTILNRNAAALAAHLAAQAADPASPVKKAWYPAVLDTKAHHDAVLRPATPDFAPGYGCLLSVDFHTHAAARAFYNAFPAHNGPHLGGHRMLALNFNALVLGRVPEDMPYHASYGAHADQVRISTGLEDEADVIAAAKAGLEAAERAYHTQRKQGDGGASVVDDLLKGAPDAGVSPEELKAIAHETSANFE